MYISRRYLICAPPPSHSHQSILQLCCAPSLRGCMCRDYLTPLIFTFAGITVIPFPLGEGGARRAGDGSASQRRDLQSRRSSPIPSIHPAALPRPFSKGLHVKGSGDFRRQAVRHQTGSAAEPQSEFIRRRYMNCAPHIHSSLLTPNFSSHLAACIIPQHPQ